MTVKRSWHNAIILATNNAIFSCSGGSVMQYLSHQSITDAPDGPTTPPATRYSIDPITRFSWELSWALMLVQRTGRSTSCLSS